MGDRVGRQVCVPLQDAWCIEVWQLPWTLSNPKPNEASRLCCCHHDYHYSHTHGCSCDSIIYFMWHLDSINIIITHTNKKHLSSHHCFQHWPIKLLQAKIQKLQCMSKSILGQCLHWLLLYLYQSHNDCAPAIPSAKLLHNLIVVCFVV